MKTNLEVQEGLTRKITVDVAPEVVNAAFNKVFKDIQKSANIKGFRKGKAPLTTVKSVYAEKVKSDVLQDLVAEGYNGALEKHSLDPINQPEISIGSPLEEGKEFSFSASFEIRPNVTLQKTEGLVIEKEILAIEDAEVEKSIDNIRANRAETIPVSEDRSAQNGDIADINFDGYVDGEPLQGGKADNHKLELGSNSFIPGFEEGVLGMKTGEDKEINLKFPDDYHAAEIAGKAVLFKVKLNSLNQKSLPELNDGFAQTLGDYKNVAELKTAIREQIEANEKNRIEEDMKNRVLHALVKANPVEVPKTLLTRQKEALIEDVHKKMHQQGLSHKEFEEYKSKWDEDFTQTASFMIQSNFLVDKLAQDLGAAPSDKEVDELISKQASQMGMDFDTIKNFYQQQGRISALRYQLVEQKVVSHLIEKATIKELPKDKVTPIEG